MRRWWLVTVLLGMVTMPAMVQGAILTPEVAGTPGATPLAFDGCGDLGAYFMMVADLANGNAGYVAVRSHPDGVFQVDSAAAAERVVALDDLLGSLGAITPPEEAAAWHGAFMNVVLWYRDLAASRDMTDYQRIVNRDKSLIPALSQATLAGQAVCGSDVWQAAYVGAFGE